MSSDNHKLSKHVIEPKKQNSELNFLTHTTFELQALYHSLFRSCMQFHTWVFECILSKLSWML